MNRVALFAVAFVMWSMLGCKSPEPVKVSPPRKEAMTVDCDSMRDSSFRNQCRALAETLTIAHRDSLARELKKFDSTFTRWQITETVNPVTDKRTAKASHASIDYVSDPTHGGLLAFFCGPNGLITSLTVSGFFSGPVSDIVWRLDSLPPKSDRWSVSEGGSTLLIDDDGARLLKFGNHRQLRFEVHPYGQGAQFLAFDITGIDSLVIPAVRRCLPSGR